ncbi:MAG: hypothetical protein EXR53_01210 [Dehalococcoidia bacterium]|nr:hypothetical protein [Dehalococcoidia bacterium]
MEAVIQCRKSIGGGIIMGRQSLLAALAAVGNMVLVAAIGILPVAQADDPAAQEAEFQAVSTAFAAMMVGNGLSVIPVRYAGNDAPCVTGTQNMTKYPDATSTLAHKQAQLGVSPAFAVGDKLGYTLYAHDMTGGGVLRQRDGF